MFVVPNLFGFSPMLEENDIKLLTILFQSYVHPFFYSTLKWEERKTKESTIINLPKGKTLVQDL